MKRIILLVVMISVLNICFGQSSPQANGEFHASKEKIHLQSYLPTSSILMLRTDNSQNEMQMYEGEHAIDKCASYHKMKIAGIILSAVGGGLIITGAVIRGAAYNRNLNGDITYNDYNAQMNGGAAMVGLGALCAGAGIPLAIIGSVKTRRYCRGGAAY